jgi:hypothetical protein
MSRLSEARRRLQRRLSRRGLAPSAGLIGAVLAAEAEVEAAATALPPALVKTLTRSAILFATDSSPAGAIPQAVAILTREVLNAMFLTKVKGLAAAVAALGVITLGTVVLAQSPGPRRDAPGAPAAPQQALAANVGNAAESESKSEQDKANEEMTPYPVRLDRTKLREYPALTIEHGAFRLTSGPIALAPISCEPGVTGAMLIGDGTFRFTSEKGKEFTGHFRAAMLRFNPADQATFAPLDKGQKLTDAGLYEMSRHLMNGVFGHCWHSGDEALIPPKGSFTVVLFSREHGDLLISADEKTEVVVNFTERKTVHEKKP